MVIKLALLLASIEIVANLNGKTISIHACNYRKTYSRRQRNNQNKEIDFYFVLTVEEHRTNSVRDSARSFSVSCSVVSSKKE